MVHLLLAVIYLSFISLGLPDSVLGAAWPSMYGGFSAPLSYAGILSMIISVGTILSSLQSDRLTRRFGTGKVTAVSVALTAAALFGFSVSQSFWQLCLWAIPYGLGAGSVDASLNNYVALHFASRHMSWLHCMWGIGASAGPLLMGMALTGGKGWQAGYRTIALLQAALTAILFISLPLWKRRGDAADEPDDAADTGNALTLKEIFRIPGAKAVVAAFFCYCALEQTAGLWASSFLIAKGGLAAEAAAGLAGLFYMGITGGRALSGFLTLRLDDAQMIRLGQAVIALGILTLLAPFGAAAGKAGMLLMGLGCAPVYPCIIHSTPEHFGKERSQAMIGVQMAGAYVGTCLMPPVFGLLAGHGAIRLYPFYLLALLAVMFAAHGRLRKKA